MALREEETAETLDLEGLRSGHTGQLLDWECGRRDKATLKKMVDRLASWDVKVCTDQWGNGASVSTSGQTGAEQNDDP